MRRPIDLVGGVSIGQEFGGQGANYAQFGLIGHHGVDYPAPIGRPVFAPENAKITQSANGVTDKYTGRFASGETIVLEGSYEHWLMHLSRRLVSAGQRVVEGQLIGYSGNTGFSDGPHLHWGVRPLNPNLKNGYRGFINPGIVLTKAPAPTPAPAANKGDEMFTSDDQIQAAYYMLRGKHATDPEVAGWRGKSILQFITNQYAKQEIANRESYKNQLEQKVIALETALTNEKNKPPKEIIKEVEKIVEKPVEVIKEVQVAGPPVDERTVVTNWFKRIWENLFK